MTQTPTEVAARALGGQRVGSEWRAWCPVHEADRRGRPSLTVREGVDGLPVFQCESQNCSRDHPPFLAALAKVVPAETLRGGGAPPLDSAGEPDTAKLDNPLPSSDRLALWSRQLADRANGWDEDPDAEALRACLSDRYGADESICRALGIGLWAHRHGEGVHQGVWLIVPVLSADGDLVNVREWNPLRAKGRRVRNWTGHGSPALLGAHKVGDWPADAPILLCEGEGDWLAATAAGLRAVTGTGGASNPPENLACLRGRTVVVAYDNDAAGRNGAQKVAHELHNAGARVYVGDVGAYMAEPGADVRDLLLHADHGPSSLAEVMDRALAATPWHPDAARLDSLVQNEQERLAVRAAAAALDAARDWKAPADGGSLADQLRADPEPLHWYFDNLLFRGANVLLTAEAKAGKTTLALNVVRSLVDGVDLFGHFSTPGLDPGRGVAWWNAELSETQAVAWLRSLEVEADGLVFPLHLRGQDVVLTNPAVQDWAVGWLQRHDISVWVLDPFSALFPGDENSSQEVGAWLRAVDSIKARAGVDTVLVVHHSGHASRTDEDESGKPLKPRGSSRLTGWPDVLWSYTGSGSAPRYLAALGRDVDMSAFGGLVADPTTRHLRWNHNPRSHREERTHQEALRAARVVRGASGPLKATQLQDELPGSKPADKRKWINHAEAQGWIRSEPGRGNSTLYSPGDVDPFRLSLRMAPGPSANQCDPSENPVRTTPAGPHPPSRGAPSLKGPSTQAAGRSTQHDQEKEEETP